MPMLCRGKWQAPRAISSVWANPYINEQKYTSGKNYCLFEGLGKYQKQISSGMEEERNKQARKWEGKKSVKRNRWGEWWKRYKLSLRRQGHIVGQGSIPSIAVNGRTVPILTHHRKYRVVFSNLYGILYPRAGDVIFLGHDQSLSWMVFYLQKGGTSERGVN